MILNWALLRADESLIDSGFFCLSIVYCAWSSSNNRAAGGKETGETEEKRWRVHFQ